MTRYSGFGCGTVLLAALGLAGCGGNTESGSASGGTGTGGTHASGGSGGSAAFGGSGTGATGGSGGTGATGGIGGVPQTGCTLALLASGLLPEPVAPQASLSGPGVAATDTGFMIGYRDQSGDTLRAVLASLDDSGTLGQPNVFDLTGCSNKIPTDGVGVAYSAGAGLFVSSLPDCGKGAGVVLAPFDGKGNVATASGPRNASFKELTVSANAIAPTTINNEYEFLYRVTTFDPPVIEGVVLQGAGFKLEVPAAHPFGEEETVPFAMVATSPQVRAYLAPVKSKAATVVQVGLNTGDVFNPAGEFTLPFADWAAITAWDNHVVAVVPNPPELTAVSTSLAANGLVTADSSPLATGFVTGAAMTTVGDHLLVLTGTTGTLSVRKVPGAKADLNFGQSEAADFNPGNLPELSGEFDGSHVAIAAARGRVVVVWLTSEKLGTVNETGGWAMLQCAE